LPIADSNISWLDSRLRNARVGNVNFNRQSAIGNQESAMTLLGSLPGALSGGQRTPGLALSQLAACFALQLRRFIGTDAAAAIKRQYALDLGMWTRNNVHADQFADPTGRGCAGIGSSLDGAYVSPHKHGHIAGADIFLTQQLHVGCFDHRISRFDSADKAFGLDHSECFKRHLRQSSLFKIVEVKNKADWFLRTTQATTLGDKNQDRSSLKSIKFDNVYQRAL
jgi:hypothetical protein